MQCDKAPGKFPSPSDTTYVHQSTVMTVMINVLLPAGAVLAQLCHNVMITHELARYAKCVWGGGGLLHVKCLCVCGGGVHLHAVV